MGYDLHITRRAHWVDDEGPSITEEEWLRLVESDPDLRFDPENGPHHALWSGQSANPEPWLAWDEGGEIFTKNPDDALIRKMIAIAARLGAKVQGDEGELYDEAHPTGWSPGREQKQRSRFASVLPVALLVLAGLIGLGIMLVIAEALEP